MSDNGSNLENLLASDSLARSFLAYQLVHDKQNACQHFQSNGIIYKALSWTQTMQLAAGGNMPIEPAIPEIAVFLFAKENVDYTDYPEDRLMLTSERQSQDRESQYLNAIDPFIIKYFVAELDENRKEQEDRRVNDERGGYRGGRKVSVGLAVRNAIVTGKSDEEIGAIFQNALIANNITQEEFFDGSTRKFLKEPVYSLLADPRPANTISLGR
ncbi:MAG: hypothetical protein LRY69_03265 [Gammaproteobacteria bacterium]|nr:hypothetical protein [Gammaproteobacteria bacterium]